MSVTPVILAFNWPIRLQYMPGWIAAALFAALALPVVWLGIRSLNGLGPVRKWVAVGVRLAVLLLLVLVLGGIRWQRQHRDLEVILLSDVSDSINQVHDFPSDTLQRARDKYYVSLSRDPTKRPDDRMGIVAFRGNARIDVMPSTALNLGARAIPKEDTGTNIAAAIQLALATMSPDAMHRFVLESDGNPTVGELDAAVNAAIAAHVPIDVVPLRYDIRNEVLLDRFVAPTMKRENEPFTLDVILRSTNPGPVKGALSVTHETNEGPVALDMDLNTPQLDPQRQVVLEPGLNAQRVQVRPLKQAGVHRFHATFTPEEAGSGGKVTVENPGAAPGKSAGSKGDTLANNNDADAFTFVQGKGQVLYVDNIFDTTGSKPGDLLLKALAAEGITLHHISIDQFPSNVVGLQNYDAVILANVPRGNGGIDENQAKMLAAYVHDMGGGLVMIGGENTFGAGGWQGSKLEEVLPVDMDIPAQRQVGKGALVLVMHSCEMPDGNYYGQQCALKAIETLSSMDDVGIITYGWNGGASGWDYPLSPKGDGSKVFAAVKKMQPGDMVSFDDSMNVAFNGLPGQPGLATSNAQHKHVIIISDGDPQAPNPALVAQYKAAKVSVSTVTVYPHGGNANGRSDTMDNIARDLLGRAYGPINANPNQLPQIFIKEATIVRRTLINEPDGGIPVRTLDNSDEMVKGLGEAPPLKGQVLTSRKNDPKVVMPLASGKNNDPVLAHWQTGLGKAAVFTGDAHTRWGAAWVASSVYSKFWAQVVRSVARPPMSTDFDVQTTISGDKGKVIVEALNRDQAFLNFLSIAGTVSGPDLKTSNIRLVQTGPGTYEGEFDIKNAGSYVVGLNYRNGKGDGGFFPGGVAMSRSPEQGDLTSNEGRLREIADRTGGRVLTAFEPKGADLFSREGLSPSASPMPVWDKIIPLILALILIDVAVRRIAWDWASTKRMAHAAAETVRAFTTTRKVESGQTLDALRRVREEVTETRFRTEPSNRPPAPSAARPDPKAKFQAKGVEGDITQVVGGATDKPIPPPPKKIEPKGAPSTGSHTGGLLEAKRRAQQQIREKGQQE